MKIIKLVVLSGVLLLSSCTVPVKPADDAVPAFHIDGALPEIGQFSGNAQYSRFFHEHTPEFIPSDEYGRVIPFIGSSKEYFTPKREQEEYNYSMSSKYNSYGFCTEDGRIVMDANSNINYISHNVTEDGFGYYTWSVMPEQDENTIPDDVYIGNKSYFLPDSGEWILELSQGSYVSAAGNGVVAVSWVSEDNEEMYPAPDCIRLYNYDGELLREIENEDSAEKMSHDMMLVRNFRTDTTSSRFVNIKGETVLGPYENANPFMGKGFASVKEYDGNWYFIDTSGNKVNGVAYDSIGQIYGKNDIIGYRAIRKDNILYSDIFDLDLNLLCTVKTPSRYCSIHMTDNGEVYFSYYDDGEVYVNSEGNRIINEEFGVEANRYSPTDNLLVHRDEETGKSIIFDYDGSTVAVLDSLEYLNEVSKDGRYLCYSSGNVNYEWNEQTQENIITDTTKFHIYDTVNKTETVSFDGSGSCRFAGQDERYIIVGIYDAAEMFGDSSRYFMYDTKTQRLVFENCLNIDFQYIDSKYYYLVSTANKSTLYDENLNVILRTINE